MVAFAAAACGVRDVSPWRALARRAGIALLAAAAALAAPRAEAAHAALVLQLNGPADFEYAGYFAALWKGFYDAAGLRVEIRPGSMLGQPRIDPAHEVAEGHAQFGVGTMTLVVRAGQGMPLVLLAPVFQASGTDIYYRAAADFASPGALAKAKIGLYPATDMLGLELATALRGDGIDPGKVRSIALDPGQAVAALADRRVDAVAGSAWVLPWQARARGLSLKSINPADYRVEFYGDTLFTLARFARDHPDTVRRFREASLKGWAYALDHADEIAARLVKDLPPPPGISDAAGFARYQIGVARELARYPAVPLGHSSLERWARIEQSLADSGALVRTTGPASFVYDPAAESGRRTEWRDGLILAALLAATLVTIAALLLWRHRRAAAPGAPASVEPAAPEPEIAPEAATPAETAPKAEPAPAALAEPSPEPAADPVLQSPAPAPATTDLNVLLSALEPALRDRMPQSAAFRLSLLPEL
ncbi:MAG: ABC transporter substrate-binding protein, partial [Stellaceae bacterium]